MRGSHPWTPLSSGDSQLARFVVTAIQGLSLSPFKYRSATNEFMVQLYAKYTL